MTKPVSIAAAAAALFGALAALVAPRAGAQGRPPARTAKESPFACDRLALSPAERKRHFEEVGPALFRRKTGVRELPDGYALQFPAELATLHLLAEWSLQERRCCPFLEIDLQLEREGGPLWLRLTGRKGTKQFLEAETGLRPQGSAAGSSSTPGPGGK
jgi:hypothetical protein